MLIKVRKLKDSACCDFQVLINFVRTRTFELNFSGISSETNFVKLA